MDKRQQTCCFTGHRILPRGMEDELWTKTYAHLHPPETPFCTATVIL